jgi:hypothetical protein
MKRNLKLYSVILIAAALASCKDLVSIPEPVGSVTTKKVFATDAQATSAMAGVYTRMINKTPEGASGLLGFATGMSTIFGGMSGNELLTTHTSSSYYHFNTNRLLADNTESAKIWISAYDAVYGCNAVIEGIEASVSENCTKTLEKN